MNAKTSATAQKLLNLYRQEHVIIGGWATVNPVFINEATDEVIRELRELPTGKMLVQHIENLRTGKTPMDSIERELLPYGGLMIEENITNTQLQQSINDIIGSRTHYPIKLFIDSSKFLTNYTTHNELVQNVHDYRTQSIPKGVINEFKV